MTGITDPAQEFFKDGTWGWNGSVWRKLPMVWGYSEQYGEAVSDLAPSGGNETLTFSVVPAGEVWIVENIAATDSTNSPSRIRPRAVVSAGAVTLTETLNPGAGVMVTWGGRVTLAEGDYIKVDYTGVTAGDDLFANACGYKMKIAE